MDGKSSLRIAYQPIVALGFGASIPNGVIGYEALLRMGGLSPLEAFHRAVSVAGPEAEVELDLTCIRMAVECARGFAPGQRLFVNLAPATVAALADGALCLSSIFTAAPPLVFEVSEREWSPAPEAGQWRRLHDALRAVGEIALDDVGDGFGDLTRIRQLRPQWLKLSRSLIAHLDEDDGARTIVRAMVSMAAEIGAQVVAEGIETPAEAEACRLIGVRHAQGYLFGRPEIGQGEAAGGGESALVAARCAAVVADAPPTSTAR